MKNAFINAIGVLTSFGYALSNNADTLIEVPDDFNKTPGEWRYINGDWAPYSAPPTLEQLEGERKALAAVAKATIEPLQYAVDLGDATADEQAKLLAWKRYAVALNRMDMSAPVWPDVPTQ